MTKILASLLFLIAVQYCRAADSGEEVFPIVTTPAFPGQTGRVEVATIPGKPTDPSLQTRALAGGFPNDDYPPHTQLVFTDRYHPYRKNYLEVFRLKQVQEAPYVSIQPCIEQLRRLLHTQRTSQLDKLNPPVFPFRNAGRTIQSKTRYFHAAWGDGIFYITSFASGNGDYPANDSFEYLFQGLTKDGEFYVSGDFSLSHPRFARRDYVRLMSMDHWDTLLRRAHVLLSKLPDRSFSPALNDVRAWLSALEIK